MMFDAITTMANVRAGKLKGPRHLGKSALAGAPEVPT
jgi:hypothetical protein